MTKARVNADNASADIQGVTAGTGLSGGGTSGTVTLTNDMATTIDAKGDLVVGTGADTYTRVPVGSNNQVLTADSATTSGVKWATADALPSQTGNSGKYLTTNGTTASWGTVNQPLTWTQRIVQNSNGDPFNSIAYNGTDLYIAAGYGGLLYTSTDGITWTSRTSGFGTQTIWRVAYGNGLWVAVGGNGIITTSTDGTTWTARTSNMSTNAMYDVIYANSTWVAVGDGGGSTNTGGITYSSDGTTWTRKSQSLTVGTSYYGIVHNGTNFVIAANNSTNNYLYASTPSGTWTVGASGSGTSLEQIYFDGTRLFTVDNSGNTRFTTSATVGTMTSFLGATLRSSRNKNYLYDEKLYSFGQIIWRFSSTPVNNYINLSENFGFGPDTKQDSSGNVTTIGVYSVFVGSIGYIVAGSQGQIWTSF